MSLISRIELPSVVAALSVKQIPEFTFINSVSLVFTFELPFVVAVLSVKQSCEVTPLDLYSPSCQELEFNRIRERSENIIITFLRRLAY